MFERSEYDCHYYSTIGKSIGSFHHLYPFLLLNCLSHAVSPGLSADVPELSRKHHREDNSSSLVSHHRLMVAL